MITLNNNRGIQLYTKDVVALHALFLTTALQINTSFVHGIVIKTIHDSMMMFIMIETYSDDTSLIANRFLRSL